MTAVADGVEEAVNVDEETSNRISDGDCEELLEVIQGGIVQKWHFYRSSSCSEGSKNNKATPTGLGSSVVLPFFKQLQCFA